MIVYVSQAWYLIYNDIYVTLTWWYWYSILLLRSLGIIVDKCLISITAECSGEGIVSQDEQINQINN